MKDDEILARLEEVHLGKFALETLNNLLQEVKEKYVADGNEAEAKKLWIYQQIVNIHNLFRNAFDFLKQKKYYDGWCKLERIEIQFNGLKKHFYYDENLYFLSHIEKSVKNLQVLFPYKLFASSEILKKRKKCSICDKEITIRTSCGHVSGEIYRGEMCCRIVTEAEVLGIALVENPNNKYSVVFHVDKTTDKQVDQYNYQAVEYLFELIKSPYELWNLEVSEKDAKDHYGGNVGRNDLCPCNSGNKFKKCCLGKKIPHYQFILKNPSGKALFTRV